MLVVPLYALLFIYLAFLVFFAVFILINLAHLFHTGTLTMFSFIITLFVLAFSAIILWGTWYFLQNVNWQVNIINWNFSIHTGISLPDNGGL